VVRFISARSTDPPIPLGDTMATLREIKEHLFGDEQPKDAPTTGSPSA
jgi:hypothetical protein